MTTTYKTISSDTLNSLDQAGIFALYDVLKDEWLVTHASCIIMAYRRWQRALNRNDLDLYILETDHKDVVARNICYGRWVEKLQAEGKKVVSLSRNIRYKFKIRIELETVIQARRNVALANVYLETLGRGSRRLVGVFEKMGEAEAFILNAGGKLHEGIQYADNELTKIKLNLLKWL